MLDIDLIQDVLFMVKNDLKAKYKTTDLNGKFIEAAESIVSILQALGYKDACIVTNCCKYNNGSARGKQSGGKYVWIKLDEFYIDVAADHFNLF